MHKQQHSCMPQRYETKMHDPLMDSRKQVRAPLCQRRAAASRRCTGSSSRRQHHSCMVEQNRRM